MTRINFLIIAGILLFCSMVHTEDDCFYEMGKGAMLISLGSGYGIGARAELLVTDPEGRRAGRDVSTGKILQEIPCGHYGKEGIGDFVTGELGIDVNRFEAVNPINGVYKVAAIGTSSGHYHLEVFADDIEDNTSVKKLNGTTYPGKIDYYEITYSSAPGSQLQVEFVGSSEMYEVSCTTNIYPHQWNLTWYTWIKEHMGEREWIAKCAERVSILCIIRNLKDNQGNPHSVDEILPETLLLNNVLPYQPWKCKGEEERAIILRSGDNRHLSTRKGFREWHRGRRFFKDPVMLIKFNKVKSMETLPEMIPGKEYEVTISGKLKDGKSFKGSKTITITEWKVKPRWKWDHPDWLNADRDVEHWWNQEGDLEDWWEKIKRHPRPEPENR